MPSPLFIQIRSTIANVLIILIFAPALGVWLAFMGGEIHGWKDFPKALDHGLMLGAAMAFGWLLMKSPGGEYFRTLISSLRTTTDPDGQVHQEKVLVSSPLPQPGTKTTTSIESGSAQVTQETHVLDDKGE
jgi:hypothetical protein